MSLPVVAIVGATGSLGSSITNSFLESKKGGRVKELRVFTSKKSSKTEEFEKEGAKVFEVNFSRKDTLLLALKCVDVVVCAIGMGENLAANKNALLEAMTQSGVDVYIPSEFGINHYSPPLKFSHPVFDEKQHHFREAQQKSGLKTVRIYCSAFMEFAFTKMLGLDCETGVWKIPGQGNTPVAVTAFTDIARFTVEAALLAFKDPNAVPDELQILSVSRTIKEYAAIFETISGRKFKVQNLSLEDAIQKYEKTKDFLTLLPILFETGALAVTPEAANGNQLLNPNQSVWNLKSIEKHAEELSAKPAM